MHFQLRICRLGTAVGALLLAASPALAQTFTDAINAFAGPGNTIYASGTYTPNAGSPVSANLRLTSTGAIDGGFTPVTTNPGYAFGVLGNGNVVVNGNAGVSIYSSTGSLVAEVTEFMGARTLTIDGSGTSFYTGSAKYNSNGSLAFNYASSFETLSMTVTSGGQILLGGQSGNFVRLDSSGALDSTFSATAAIAIGTGSVHGIAVQSGGGIIVTGQGLAAGANVIRLNSDGSLDNSFVAGTTSFGPVAIAADGTLLISTGSNSTNITFDSADRIVTVGSVVRLTANGSLHSLQPILDSTFDQSHGVAVYQPLTAIPEPSTYAVLAGVLALGAARVRAWRRRIENVAARCG